MAFGDRLVDLVLIVSAIAGEGSERTTNLVEKYAGLRAVVDLSRRQLDRNDLTAVGIDANMQLAPGSTPRGAVLLD